MLQATFLSRRLFHPLVALLVCTAAAGGFTPATTFGAETTPSAQAAAVRPVLIHLNGIGGRRMIDRMLVSGLEQGGFRFDCEYFDWTEGEIGLVALTGYEKHKAQARKLADLIIARWKAEPATPFYITAHSGGAGIAAFALELLPDDVKIESVVFFAPALSPTYDLSKALRHVNTRLIVFSSPLDAAVLSTGTRLFGTIDGIRGDAAGLKGFIQPETCADASQYQKLIAQPYQRSWLSAYGNAGSHICAMRPQFVRDYVTPLLLNRAGDPIDAEQPRQSAPLAPAPRP